MRNYIKTIVALVVVSLVLTSCKDKRKPNVQYFPDMYESVAYEPYASKAVFENNMEALTPVEGTIARGEVPYEYADSNEGYEAAKTDLKSPLEVSEKNAKKGKELYGIYCAVCHGGKGAGQGDLVKREKFLGIPSYKDRDITEGSIYHVIMYGRNMMGSHASQLTHEERWQVVQHVQKLRNDLLK